MTKGKNRRSGKKASAEFSLLTFIEVAIAVVVIALVIIPMVSRILGLNKPKNTELAKGFPDLVEKAEMLKSDGDSLIHVFSVDNDYWLVGFDNGQPTKGAHEPPVCAGAACLCVCIDDNCATNADTSANKGQDCKILDSYTKIEVVPGVKGNDGGAQLYVSGEEKLSLKLTKQGSTLLISQPS